MMRLLLIIISTIIVLLALFPRSVELLNRNYLFGFDQGRDYLAVKEIVVDRNFRLIGSEIGAGAAGFRGIFHGPFYYYLLSIPFLLFQGDPYGGIILLFLLGIGSVVFGFYFGKQMFGLYGGLLVLFLLAISPPLIAQSRFVWNTNPVTIFVLVAFFFTYSYFKTKRTLFLFLAVFFSAFTYNFQLGIAIPLTISIVLFSLFVLRAWKIKQVFLIIAGAFLAFSPMILFEVRNKFLGMRGLIDYVFVHKETAVTQRLIEALLKDELQVFLYNFYYTFFEKSIIPIGLLLPLVFVPCVYFLFNEKEKHLKLFVSYLLTTLLITFIVFANLRNSVYQYYLVHLNIVYVFLLSYSIYRTFKGNRLSLKIGYSLFLLVVFVYGSKEAVMKTYLDFQDFGGDAKIAGKLQAIDYIYHDAKMNNFGLLVFSPPIYTYPYDYLLWWYGSKKYHYIPHSKKEGTFYLLIETDRSKPWSYKGWLETVIKTGKVEYTKQLPSGFIIQKRVAETAEK